MKIMRFTIFIINIHALDKTVILIITNCVITVLTFDDSKLHLLIVQVHNKESLEIEN